MNDIIIQKLSSIAGFKSQWVSKINVSDGQVALDIALPESEKPNKEQIRSVISETLGQLSDVKGIFVTVLDAPKSAETTLPDKLKNIKNIIAVSSCKGGVGKSSMSTLMAIDLSERGYKVGLLDADIHGPSLPTLFQLQGEKVYGNAQKQIIPFEWKNLKLMSFGFLLGDAPAVMRGPIVTRYIQQLLFSVDWGELDYLLIDMPPGTGDVQITITQSVQVTGAVIISTRQSLSVVDVARGILMFEKVNVPILGVIENMSYFADDTGKKHYIYGGQKLDLTQQFGVKMLGEVPILESIAQTLPLVDRNSYVQEATDKVLNQLKDLENADQSLPQVTFDENNIHFNWPDGRVWKVDNRTLRINSHDALSYDEMTGEKLFRDEDIAVNVHPKQVVPLGNYAIGVDWSDGHSAGIYPYTLIEQLAK